MSETFDPTASFDALRSRLEGGLEPVRPFAAGRWMALFVALFAPLAAAALGSALGWRTAAPAGAWVWGLSAIELLAAIGLLVLALREAVPAKSSSPAAIAVGAAAAAALHAAVALAIYSQLPIAPMAGDNWRIGRFCFSFEVALGVPCLLFALALGRRGLTASPRRLALLGGLGAGLAADAIWRLVCPYSAPPHVFAFHTPGVVTVVACGLLAAAGWERLRVRAWRRRAAGGR